MQRLRLVTRADLSYGQQASQLVHGMAEFWAKNTEEAFRWYKESNTIVLLTSKDEAALRKLLHPVLSVPVFEPDLQDALTALTFSPCLDSKKICRPLPLAFR